MALLLSSSSSSYPPSSSGYFSRISVFALPVGPSSTRKTHGVLTEHGHTTSTLTKQQPSPPPLHHAEGGPGGQHNAPHHQPLNSGNDNPPSALESTVITPSSPQTHATGMTIATPLGDTSTSSTSHKLSGGNLAAAIIVPLLVVALLAVLVFLVLRYRRTRRLPDPATQASMSRDSYMATSMHQDRDWGYAARGGNGYYSGLDGPDDETYNGVRDIDYTQAYTRQTRPHRNLQPYRSVVDPGAASEHDEETEEEEDEGPQRQRPFSFAASEYERGTEADRSTVSDWMLPSTSGRAPGEDPSSPVSEIGGRFESRRRS